MLEWMQLTLFGGRGQIGAGNWENGGKVEFVLPVGQQKTGTDI